VEAAAEAPKESTQSRSEHILYVDDEEAWYFWRRGCWNAAATA